MAHMTPTIRIAALEARVAALEALLRPGPPVAKVEAVQAIQTATAQAFGVTVRQMLGRRRTPRSLLTARHVAMWLAYKTVDLSMPDAAELFNRKDHTTVIYAMRKVEAFMETETETKRIYDELFERFVK